MIIAGIDCGYKTGGVGLVGDGWVEVHDLPTYSEGGLNSLALADILESVDVDHVVIESQQAMPRQGVSSTFKLGMGYGQITATVAMTRIPFTTVTPAKWKRAMNLPKDKDAARRLATQWYPDIADQLKRKKDEHRAEALLIATYYRGGRV